MSNYDSRDYITYIEFLNAELALGFSKTAQDAHEFFFMLIELHEDAKIYEDIRRYKRMIGVE